jgi:hypothetical protein
MGWINGVLVGIDQLGNAIAGGNPDATVSARVGYFSQLEECRFQWYWRLLEWVIDTTFYSIDGPRHCYQAFRADQDERFQDGSDIARAVLGGFILLACPVIAFMIRLLVLIKPTLGYRNKRMDALTNG